ncbi:MAG: phosphoenolpyruvate carboxykinase domain-containing protein [Ferruginibacter sp.]
MESIKANTIFTGSAITRDADVWWEGMTPGRDTGGIDRLEGQALRPVKPDSLQLMPTPGSPRAGATESAIDPTWDDPNGVPIKAFIFGGRRSTAARLVCQSFN